MLMRKAAAAAMTAELNSSSHTHPVRVRWVSMSSTGTRRTSQLTSGSSLTSSQGLRRLARYQVDS